MRLQPLAVHQDCTSLGALPNVVLAMMPNWLLAR